MREKKKFYRYENQSDGRNNFMPIERMLYSAGKNYFATKDEATKHFKESYEIALDKHKDILKGIKELKERLGDFSYDYFINGDTHGLEDGLYISFNANGYDFEFGVDD